MNQAALIPRFATLLLLAVMLPQRAVAAEPMPEFDFAHRIAPLLKKHCYECHGGHRAEGDFSINTREAIVDSTFAIPGDAANSYIVEVVTSDDVETRMPLEKPPLAEPEVNTLREWI